MYALHFCTRSRARRPVNVCAARALPIVRHLTKPFLPIFFLQRTTSAAVRPLFHSFPCPPAPVSSHIYGGMCFRVRAFPTERTALYSRPPARRCLPPPYNSHTMLSCQEQALTRTAVFFARRHRGQAQRGQGCEAPAHGRGGSLRTTTRPLNHNQPSGSWTLIRTRGLGRGGVLVPVLQTVV